MLGTSTGRDTENPKEALKQFIEDLVKFLNQVVEGSEEKWRPRFRAELVAPMRAAREVLDSHADEIIEKLKKLEDSQINDHGLHGVELEFKFAVIDDAYNAADSATGYAGWWRLIKSLDVLLESILAATKAGTAVSELKDYIGLSVEGP